MENNPSMFCVMKSVLRMTLLHCLPHYRSNKSNAVCCCERLNWLSDVWLPSWKMYSFSFYLCSPLLTVFLSSYLCTSHQAFWVNVLFVCLSPQVSLLLLPSLGEVWRLEASRNHHTFPVLCRALINMSNITVCNIDLSGKWEQNETQRKHNDPCHSVWILTARWIE